MKVNISSSFAIILEPWLRYSKKSLRTFSSEFERPNTRYFLQICWMIKFVEYCSMMSTIRSKKQTISVLLIKAKLVSQIWAKHSERKVTTSLDLSLAIWMSSKRNCLMFSGSVSLKVLFRLDLSENTSTGVMSENKAGFSKERAITDLTLEKM